MEDAGLAPLDVERDDANRDGNAPHRLPRLSRCERSFLVAAAFAVALIGSLFAYHRALPASGGSGPGPDEPDGPDGPDWPDVPTKPPPAADLSNATKRMFEALAICGECNEFKRFGEVDDGGYLTCVDPSLDDLKAVLSIGIEQHDQWSADMVSTYNLPVGQFDCTVDTGADCDNNCSFWKLCLASEDNHEQTEMTPYTNLSTMIEMLAGSDVPDRSIFLKMDIEGSEWPVFQNEPLAVLKKIRQIVIEFHWLDQVQNHEMYAEALENLKRANFSIVHLHGNNNQDMWYPGHGLSLPIVLEATLLAEAPMRSECLYKEDVNDLDHPNGSWRPELPAAIIGPIAFAGLATVGFFFRNVAR